MAGGDNRTLYFYNHRVYIQNDYVLCAVILPQAENKKQQQNHQRSDRKKCYISKIIQCVGIGNRLAQWFIIATIYLSCCRYQQLNSFLLLGNLTTCWGLLNWFQFEAIIPRSADHLHTGFMWLWILVSPELMLRRATIVLCSNCALFYRM